MLAAGATLTGVPTSLSWLTAYWPVIYGVAFGLHQLASTFGVTPDIDLSARLAAIIPPLPINAAEYRAGMNIAMRGDQLPGDASRSARAGFACVAESERGKYDANGALKPTATA